MVYLVILVEGMLIIGSFSYLGAYTEYLFHYQLLRDRNDAYGVWRRGRYYGPHGGKDRPPDRQSEYPQPGACRGDAG